MTGMAPSEWNQVVELFHAALDKPDDERALLLDEACGTETFLRRAVEGLLKEHQSAENFLSQLSLGSLVAATGAGAVTPAADFEHFVLLELLGRGGIGEVWSARDIELDRLVALKFLRLDTGQHVDTAAITREAKAASALNHPNIVTIHELIRSGSRSAIVMELVEGRSLADWRGSLVPLDQVLSTAVQIAKALAAAHASGIIHGDIKPENIMLRQDGYVKVLDFGLARRAAEQSVSGALSIFGGTLRYMSPEQARGESLTPASDIFSFGLVLFELSTGTRTYNEPSLLDALRALVTQDPPSPASVNPRVPPFLNALILAMLAKDPGSRPAAAEIVKRLEAAAAEPFRLRKVVGRWSLAAALLSAVLIFAAAWFLYARRDRPEFTNLRIRPLTSQSGWEADPAFSPDGKFMAFTWNEHPLNPQLYVKRVDGGDAVKLTNFTTGHPGSLAWSPDGTRIAFKIELQPTTRGEIRSIPAVGGPVSSLTTVESANVSSAIDWSPDGNTIVFSDLPKTSTQLCLYSLDLRTGKKQKLTAPPLDMWGDWSPKFSPDGKTIAFKRVRDYWLDEIYLMPAAGGPARQLTSIKASIWGHVWTASGDSLIISCQRGSSTHGIWRFSLADPLHPERIQQGAGDLISPASARNSNRIAWVNRVWDSNIYRAPLSGSEPPVRLIASTQRDQNPAVSADGRIAFISDRSNSREIWLATSEGAHQTQVTNFRGPSLDNLSWSPDGRQLAFETLIQGRPGIYLMDCAPGQTCSEPHKVISEAGSPAWAADGKALLYTRGGSTGQVWRHALYGGADMQITTFQTSFVRETRDGEWFYISKSDSTSLYRIRGSSLRNDGRHDTSAEALVPASMRVLGIGWDIGPHEIVFFQVPGSLQPWSIQALSISDNRIRSIRKTGDAYIGTDGMVLSVSHDGKWVYYPRLDFAGTNIIVADSIR